MLTSAEKCGVAW